MNKTKIKKVENPELRTIQTSRFGELEVDESAFINFPHGLIGFEKYRDYIILEMDSFKPFAWLQSVDKPALGFPIVDPALVKQDYEVKIDASELKEIGITDTTQARIFVIVTVPRGKPQEMSVNLLGPIIVNADQRRAMQVALFDSDYPTKYYLVDEKGESSRKSEEDQVSVATA